MEMNMHKGLGVLVVVAGLVPLLSCGPAEDQPTSPTQTARPVKEAATVPDERDSNGRRILFLTITPGGDPRTPRFVGLTNLPDGTEAQLTVGSKKVRYMAQAEVTVEGGRFHSSAFSNGGQPLLPGTYSVELTSPLSDLQPAQAKQAIGTGYENFVGPQFSEGLIGRTIRFETKFKVPGTLRPEAIASARQQADKDLLDFMLRSCTDIEKQAGRPTRTDQAEAKIKSCADGIFEQVKRDRKG
jgi:hypothetical protein